MLTMPAIAETGDVLGRVEGEALWPEWFDVPISERCADRSANGRASLYQGRPAPAEGALFKRAWLANFYDRAPDGLKLVTAVDASLRQERRERLSAVVTVGADGQGNMFVLHATRGRWTSTAVRAIERESSEWNPGGAILVEDAAAGQSAIQELAAQPG